MEYLRSGLFIFYILSIILYSVNVTGFSILGKAMPLKGMAVISLIVSGLATPLWLFPVANVVKMQLTVLLLILVLYYNKKWKLSFFVCSGAGLTGMAVAALLENLYTIFLAEFDSDWLFRALWSSPGAVTGALLGTLAQWYLRRHPQPDWSDRVGAVESHALRRSLQTVPVAQLYTAFLVLLTAGAVPAIPAYRMGIFFTFAAYITIILCGDWTLRYFADSKVPISPMDISDLIIVLPVIFLTLSMTGGANSPWRILLIPFILTNGLKQHASYGIGALIITASVLAAGTLGRAVAEHLQASLIFLSTSIFVLWILRSFITLENKLRAEMEQERAQMMAGLSHDLRTPITLMQGYAEMLVKGSKRAVQSPDECIQIIRSKAAILMGLIQKISELAMYRSGMMRVHLRPAAVCHLLQAIAQRYGPDIQSSGLYFQVHQKDCIGVFTTADTALLDRVFSNILYNAVRHTNSGGIIAVKAVPASEQQNIIFSIMDTGSGIAKQDLPHIFDRFYRASGQRQQGEGHGLGLAIAKEIVEIHGGRIWAESEEGRGSTFFFTLPLAGEFGAHQPQKKRHTLPIPTINLAAQGFCALSVITAYILTGAYMIPIHPVLLLYAAVVPILLLRKGQWQELINLADTALLLPLICQILLHTGGSDSPYRMLFLPLILANGMKPDKLYSILCTLAAGASLISISALGYLQDGRWFIERDICYLSLYAVVCFVVRYFVTTAVHLRDELSDARHTWLTRTAEALFEPLSSIEQTTSALKQPSPASDAEHRGYARLQEDISNLNWRIHRLYQMIDHK